MKSVFKQSEHPLTPHRFHSLRLLLVLDHPPVEISCTLPTCLGFLLAGPCATYKSPARTCAPDLLAGTCWSTCNRGMLTPTSCWPLGETLAAGRAPTASLESESHPLAWTITSTVALYSRARVVTSWPSAFVTHNAL